MNALISTVNARNMGRDDPEFAEDFCELELSLDGKTASCIVAASMFMKWKRKRPSEQRAIHKSKLTDGWQSKVSSRTSYINSMAYLRSRLGLWSSLVDLEDWKRDLEIDAEFDIAGHFSSLSHQNSDNTRYKDNNWTRIREVSGRLEVIATKESIETFDQKDQALRKRLRFVSQTSTPSAPVPPPPPTTAEAHVQKEIEDTYALAKRRLNQSLFRQMMLDLHKGTCFLTGITDRTLLVAAHIDRWADSPESRLEPGNGLLLYCEYDQYFEHGYFVFDINHKVTLTNKGRMSGEYVRKRLDAIVGKPAPASVEDRFLAVHRNRVESETMEGE